MCGPRHVRVCGILLVSWIDSDDVDRTAALLRQPRLARGAMQVESTFDVDALESTPPYIARRRTAARRSSVSDGRGPVCVHNLTDD
jgi:hypothetical protein